MKQIFTLLILLTVSLSSSAQVLAGHPLSESSNIFPDTLINGICYSTSSAESYFIDINEDAQNDYELKGYCGQSPSHFTKYVSISSLNADAYIRYERTDSSYHDFQGYWVTAKATTALSYGDTIDHPLSLWDKTTLYLNYSSSSFGSGLSFSDFISTSDLYVGIKYQIETDIGFGWIRVNCPNTNSCYVKDYSFGSQTLSINDTELSSVNIYPNPANDIITLERNLLNEAIQLHLTDVLGKEIKTGKLTNTKAAIDVSNVQEGIYFLILQTSNATATKKIIVQKR